MQNHKNSKRTARAIQTKKQNFKNQKPEIFYEMQNHKNYERTACTKQTKNRISKIQNQKFSMKCKIKKIMRELLETNRPNNIILKKTQKISIKGKITKKLEGTYQKIQKKENYKIEKSKNNRNK